MHSHVLYLIFNLSRIDKMTSFMCIAISNHTHIYCLLLLQTNTSSPTHTHKQTKKVSRIDMNEHRLVGVLKYCRYVGVVKWKHPPVFVFLRYTSCAICRSEEEVSKIVKSCNNHKVWVPPTHQTSGKNEHV